MMRSSVFLLIVFFIRFNSMTQTIYFPPVGENSWETISPSSLGFCQDKIDNLFQFLDDNNSKAFLLLKDGKIVLEKYFGTHTAATPWQWASAGKTITAFMIGVAQQEGHLSILDTTASYLGEGWTNCTTEQESKISILNQLTMTSGLDDGVSDHYCTIDTCLNYLTNAGTRWAYHNGPYTLLDKVIEQSTGQTLNAYTTQKLKTPIGMTGAFLSIGYNNVFFSTARSMARFGTLILNKGNWNGNQLMSDTVYFNNMVNTSQTMNKSYGYLWWLNGKESFMLPMLQTVFQGYFSLNAPKDMISAIGSGGQFLNIVPSQHLVWLRMGDEPSNSNVPFLLNDAIWKYVNDLACSSALNEIDVNEGVNLFPNPVLDKMTLTTKNNTLGKILVYDQQGIKLLEEQADQQAFTLDVSSLKKGVYLLNLPEIARTIRFNKFY